MKTSPASLATEHNRRFQARRGLALYFAILVPLSAVFETLMILGNLSWVWALMWTPAAASVAARLILREGFADVSFRVGGSRGWKAIVLALIFPIVIGLIAYGAAWTGLVGFNPHPITLAARFVGETNSPLVVFMTNLADFAAMNEVYSKYFTMDFPARSTVQVAALPRSANVEIEIVAHY